LPGGGTSLYQASKVLESGLPHLTNHDPSLKIGVRILEQALKQPIRLLIENKTAAASGKIIQDLDQLV
jgi:chaperonin GroEL (HSP60 family)